MVKRLFLAVPWGCLRIMIVVFPDHTHLQFSKTYLDIHFRGKNDKNGIFDVVTSCSIFDKYSFFLKKNTF